MDEAHDENEFQFGLPVVPRGDADAAGAAWYSVIGSGLPGFVVEIRVGNSPDGRLICTGLRVGGPPDTHEITARGLRQIPLSRILAALGAELRSIDPQSREYLAATLGLELAGDAAREFTRPPLPRGTRLPRSWYEKVAEVYREGLRVNPRNPYKHIMATIHTSEPTARRWVSHARSIGILGEAISGKAGEKPATTADEDGPSR